MKVCLLQNQLHKVLLCDEDIPLLPQPIKVAPGRKLTNTCAVRCRAGVQSGQQRESNVTYFAMAATAEIRVLSDLIVMAVNP